MAESVTLLALPQLVDLSLNAHEGVINFQVLHTLLHILIQQTSAQEVRVEFRGPDSEHIQKILSATKPAPQGLYPEYTVVKGRGEKKGKRISLQDVIKEKQEQHEEKRERELRVINRRKDSKEDPDPHPLPLKSPTASLAAVLTEDPQTVVVVNANSSLPQFSVAMSKNTFDGIQNEIISLKEKVNELAELPGNFGLIKAARDNSAPIVDMFQILKLTKRMDASDQAIGKMGSLIEDLAKRAGDDIVGKLEEMKEAVRSTSDVKAKSSVSISGLEERVTNLENIVNDIREAPPPVVAPSVNIKGSERDTASNVSKVTEEDNVRSITTEGTNGLSVKTEEDKGTVRKEEEVPRKNTINSDIPYTSNLSNVELGKIPSSQALSIVQQEFENLKNWMDASIKELKEMKSEEVAPSINTEVIDSKFKDYGSRLENMNDLYRNVIQQIDSLQRDLDDIATNVLPAGDSTGINAETTMELNSKLDLLQEQLVALSEQVENGQKEKEERNKQTESILDEIDQLKIVKASREELEDALMDKADACMIHGKVSHEQFDAACDDLSKGIEEALCKLEEQAEIWHHTIQAIQREVGNKLDKMDVDPIRDFVNNKLKTLQEKVKTMTGLKKEDEAAGTTMKLLKNVNCLSCEKDVVMRKEMDPTLKPQPYAMPPPRNVAPYVAFELDQLRKQQKCLPGGKGGTVTKGHICNRYCGGSHTVTTPQQRVTKLGHFLDQWGPEIAQQDDYFKAMSKSTNKNKVKSNLKSAAEPVIPVSEIESPPLDLVSDIHPVFQELTIKENLHNVGPLTLPSEERNSALPPEKLLPEVPPN